MADTSIRVRSYNVGFGDCFLVTFPDGERQRNMLIDFGNAPGKSGSNENFPAIAANIRQETGGHLDVLVMTHEHLDHMEGFYAQRGVFDTFRVDYVWMSLPSRPDYYKKYPKAVPLKKLRESAGKFAQQLNRSDIQLAPSFEVLLRNNLANAERIDYVRGLASSSKRLLYLSRGSRVLNKPFSAKVKIRVLAPEKDVSIYYGSGGHHLSILSRSLLSANGNNGSSNRDPWTFPHVPRTKAPANLSEHDWNRLRQSIQTGAVEAIRSIDKAQNNTSLVFTLQVAGKLLLFPGDAELESWRMMNSKVKRQLKPVDFLKVGHHGSHNGTPTDLLDRLLPKDRKKQATVMVSTKDKVYGTVNPVPDQALLTNLRERCRELISTDGQSALWFDAHL